MNKPILHPIIDRPYQYRIIDFQFDCSSYDMEDHSIVLTLKKDKEVKKLKFMGVRHLRIEDGFPNPTSGMQILDISDHHLEGINIEVSDFEGSHGEIYFLAHTVELI